MRGVSGLGLFGRGPGWLLAAFAACFPRLRRGSGPLAVSLAAGGDGGLQLTLLAALDGVGAAAAGIREQRLRQLAGVGEDPLQHGQQMGVSRAWLLIPTATITWWAPSTAIWQL